MAVVLKHPVAHLQIEPNPCSGWGSFPPFTAPQTSQQAVLLETPVQGHPDDTHVPKPHERREVGAVHVQGSLPSQSAHIASISTHPPLQWNLSA